MKKLRAISLFSNCGAGDVGYRQAGFEFDVMAEIDERRLEVCLLNHPEAVGISGDLRKTWPIVVNQYRKIAGKVRPSLLCACPPCQGMSSARPGKGSNEDAEAGSADERNLLVKVIAKVALKLQPDIVVVENVPAFLSRKVHHPKDKKPVSGANFLIAVLAKEYVAFPFVSDLCDFGVPQSRNRAFLTFVRRTLPGLKNILRLGHAPFPIASHGQENGTNNPIHLIDALNAADLPELDASSLQLAVAPEYYGFHSVPVWDERTYAMVSAIPQSSGNSAWNNDDCRRCGPVSVTPETVECPICSTPLLRPILKESDGRFRLIKGFASSYRRMHPNRPASTVTTASGHVGSDFTIHPTQNRVLSILECALLQTFPEDFYWGDALEKYGSTKVREMIGEAVPPAFTKLHGEVLVRLLKREWTRSSIQLNDERCTKAWAKLTAAALKDGRRDPRRHFSYANAQSTSYAKNSSQVKLEHQFVTVTGFN